MLFGIKFIPFESNDYSPRLRWSYGSPTRGENLRPKFVETFLDSLVNWDFAAENLAKA